MTPLARALLEELGPDDLAELAARLAPYLPAPAAPAPDEWLTTRQAAEHLAISVHALHRLTAAGRVPVHQDGPGARCFYRRSELDVARKTTTSSVRP